MVAFLEKPTESEGFEQIVDFLSAHTLSVDGKEIIIIESSIMRDLRLEDDKGVDCFTEFYYENLELMRKPKRKNTQVPRPSGSTKHVADEGVNEELDDRLVRAITTASSLEEEQDSGNIIQSDENKIKLNELMELCTTLQTRVLDLDKTKTTQALEIDRLKRRVKKLEKKQRSRTQKLKRLYKVGLTAWVDSSEDEQNLGEEVFVDKEIADKEVNAAGEANAASIATTDSAAATIKEITLAQALVEIKTTKLKAKMIVLQELKPVKLKKKDQIRLDEETALKLQAKFDEEEQRLERQRAQKELEANIALIETWDDVQAQIDVDYQMAKRIQVEEQQELTDDKETAELKQLMEIIPDEEEVAVDAIPLAVKQMIKNFDREDLEDLYKLVKAKYESTRSVEDLDLLLWGDLKTMFEPHMEDVVWKKQQGYKVLEWRLYDSCGVHSLRM
nr:hypothetical protein [Tanacetum cinerariifolium]